MSLRPTKEQSDWLDNPRNVSIIVRTVVVVCALLLIVDLLFVSKVWDKHAHFKFENWVGFFPVVGFVSYCTIVLTAKFLRKVLKRPEDYYDD